MNIDDFDAIFARTLDDERLTRSERRALAALLEDAQPSEADRARLRAKAFDAVRARASAGPLDPSLLDWLEDVVKLTASSAAPSSQVADVCFAPEQDCHVKIVSLLAAARRDVDVCVFTITDDRISRAILDAHRRTVRVRIITDDDKMYDRGSDVIELERAGIEVTIDNTPYHMHHKFALFDGALLLTGSYNWTRSADTVNEENFLVTDDVRLVRAYADQFEAMWERLRRG